VAEVGRDVVIERHVAARPETIFGFFRDSKRWLQWQGVEGEIDLRPGGVFRVDVTGDGYASGRFLEVHPSERIVFTWGWERRDSPVPPGSSIVTIDLVPEGGGTLVRVTHSGLPPDAADLHRKGWENYARRLALVSEGRPAGTDPLRRAPDA
jgi:uncharacterized protein YndB with AHSA1/START domain